jgi:outer membrane biosynthesis protein TonB
MTPPPGRHRYADSGDERGWLARHALPLLTLALTAAGIAFLGVFVAGEDHAQPAPKPIPQVTLLKPPPPPPPKVEPPKPKEIETKAPPEKALIEAPRPIETPKELPPLPKLDDGPPKGALGLDAVGEGAGDGYGLVGQPGGRGLIGSGQGGGGGTAGGRFAWYAGVIEASLKDALDRHEQTRDRRFRDVALQVWVDGVGRITRARLIGSTGDAEIDRLLVADVLPGLALRQPPPAELTFPIAMRIGKKT